MLVTTITMENNIETPKNLKIELTYDPAMPLQGIYLKECKPHTHHYFSIRL
jgi:hypothetical protein